MNQGQPQICVSVFAALGVFAAVPAHIASQVGCGNEMAALEGRRRRARHGVSQ